MREMRINQERNLRVKKINKNMIDWWRLGMSIFSVVIIGGLIALFILAPKVLVILGGVSLACIIIGSLILLVYNIL